MSEKSKEFLDKLSRTICDDVTMGVEDPAERVTLLYFMVSIIGTFFELAVKGLTIGVQLKQTIHIFHLVSNAFELFVEDLNKDLDQE